jgi:hypothetical protein
MHIKNQKNNEIDRIIWLKCPDSVIIVQKSARNAIYECALNMLMDKFVSAFKRANFL